MINDFLTYLVNLLSFDSSHPLLFTQIHFWVFLTIIYSLFCFIVSVGERRSRRKSPGKTNTMSTARRLWRNGYLFIVSLFFYYKTSGNYVLLLILATVLGYSLGMLFRSLVRKTLNTLISSPTSSTLLPPPTIPSPTPSSCP